MNKAIRDLNDLISQHKGNISDIQAKLQKEWNKVFDDSASLKKAISNAENASEYQFNKEGEIESWYRFDLSNYVECKEYLTNWMSDYGVSPNFDQNTLNINQGGCFVINHEGDLYDTDSGKFGLKKSDYLDDKGQPDIEKRNSLIEATMETNGYFPGVFESDYYGNVTLVNTQPKGDK